MRKSNNVVKVLVAVGAVAGAYYTGKVVGWIKGVIVTAKAFIDRELAEKKEEEKETDEEVKEE